MNSDRDYEEKEYEAWLLAKIAVALIIIIVLIQNACLGSAVL